MADIEDDAFDEDESENELLNLKNQLINQIKTAARQFCCFCGVMVFPIFSYIIEMIPTENLPVMNHYARNAKLDERADEVRLEGHLMISSIIGFIIGGVLVHFLGRKYTVIAANVSFIAAFSYSYYGCDEDETNYLTYKMGMANKLVNAIGFVAFFIYMAEIASPIFRAFFMGFYHFNGALTGEMVHETFDEFTDLHPLLRNCFILATLSFLISLFIPETPFWLSVKGKPEKAEETFTWIRANNPDMTEFNLMVARAESVGEEERILRRIFSQSFFVGFMLSIFIVIGGFIPCQLIYAVIYDFYIAKYNKYFKHGNMHVLFFATRKLLSEPTAHRYRNNIYGQLIFLSFNFVAPRKVLFFVSYILGVVVVVMIRLHPEDFESLDYMVSYCNLTPAVAIVSLTQILPVEIYPTPLREVGVVVTAILNRLYMHAYSYFFESATTVTSYPWIWMSRSFSYASFYISLFGMPFLLIFMPETMYTNLYEVDELIFDIHVPFRGQKEGLEDESMADEFEES